jgi:phosphoglycerate dehydrogenase-like enzyme
MSRAKTLSMLNSPEMPQSKPRVLVTEAEYRKAEACFVSARALECLPAPDDEADLAPAVRKMHARHVVVGLRAYSDVLYDALEAGGVIARFGVGHDRIDKVRATEAGLLCTNTPGVLNQSVAEYTMLLVGAAARKLVGAATSMAAGVWNPETGVDLHGKRLAIIGCGGIGRSVARIATLGYGMQVAGCTRPGGSVPSGPGGALEHFRLVTDRFEAAVQDADFVSLHIPAGGGNAGYINRERLAYLGTRTWLINTARGSVVDEAALVEALSTGRLGGAALDVFEREPYTPAAAGDLRTLANVILTPHVGGNTVEANRRTAERALQNIALAEAGDFARMDLLNPEVLKRAHS